MEILITLTQLSSGNFQPLNGLTGANIKFYHAPAGTVEKTGLTVTDKGNGTYQVNGFADDNAEYLLLKVDGVVQQAFGSQWIGGIPSLQYMVGIGENIAGALAARLKLDGSNSPSNHIGWGNFRLFNVGDPASGVDVGDRDYNDARYVLQSNYSDTQPAKTLYVSNQFGSVITGKRYTTIQAAIDYAFLQLPYQGNYWKIYIFPHSNSDTGYVENLTIQPNIKLIGYGLVKISGSLSGLGQYTSFENIQFQHSGNMTFNNSAVFKNCSARLTGTGTAAITFDGMIGFNFGVMTTHANHSVVSNGNNRISGWANYEIPWQGSDDAFLNYMPGVTNVDIANPTSPPPP